MTVFAGRSTSSASCNEIRESPSTGRRHTGRRLPNDLFTATMERIKRLATPLPFGLPKRMRGSKRPQEDWQPGKATPAKRRTQVFSFWQRFARPLPGKRSWPPVYVQKSAWLVRRGRRLPWHDGSPDEPGSVLSSVQIGDSR